MIKLLLQIIFAFAMLALGIAVVLFADTIRFWVSKVIGEDKDLFNQSNSTQTIWSMRFGGAMAILIGVFVLWMSLRNY